MTDPTPEQASLALARRVAAEERAREEKAIAESSARAYLAWVERNRD